MYEQKVTLSINQIINQIKSLITAIYKYRYTFGDSVVKIGTLYHKNR